MHYETIITEQPSLLPTSQTRTAISLSYDQLSRLREQYGVSTFHLKEDDGLGACYRPGDLLTTRMHRRIILLSPLPFGSGVIQLLSPVEVNDLYRRFTYVHHAAYLALTRFVVTRRVRLSRFGPRMLPRFVTLSGSLFIQTPRFIQWYRWFN